MSYYIQDALTIFITPEDEYIVMVKGGSNNIYDHNNRRYSAWNLLSVFKDKEDYALYMSKLIMSDVSRGEYKFKSLMNSFPSGFRGYENACFNLLDKKPIKFPFSVKDVTEDNIQDFQDAFVKLFCSKHKGVNSSLFTLFTEYYDSEERRYKKSNAEGVKKLNRQLDYGTELTDEERRTALAYRDFCEKYKDGQENTLFRSLEFCEEFSKFPIDYGSGVSYIKAMNEKSAIFSHSFPVENIKALLSGRDNLKRFITTDFYKERGRGLYETMPKQFSELFADPKIEGMIESIQEDLLDEIIKYKAEDEEGNKYRISQREKDIETIKSIILLFGKGFCDGVFIKATAIKSLDEKIEKEKAGLVANFLEHWNDIGKKAWYKQTYYMLPDLIDKLISIRGDMEICGVSLQENVIQPREFNKIEFGHRALTTCHRDQMKKNKKPIEEGAIRLYDNFKDIVFTTEADFRDVRCDETETLKEGDTLTRRLIGEDVIELWREKFPLFSKHLDMLELGFDQNTEYTLEAVTNADITKAFTNYKSDMKNKEHAKQKAKAVAPSPSL